MHFVTFKLQKEHPCDHPDFEGDCNKVANLVLANGMLPLSKLLRVMKVAHHVGMWSSKCTFIETKEFPTYTRPL